MKKFFTLQRIFTLVFMIFYSNNIIYAYQINSYATYNHKINKSISYILIDYYSGDILAEKNSDERKDPASLTKIMTSYVIGQSIKSGKIHKNNIVKIAKNAWATGNSIFNGSSLMFLKPGDHVSVSQLTHGIIIQSGNDACVAIADYISGNEQSFVNLMNFYAKKLSLKNTHFQNVHGLTTKLQYSSAKDMAFLSKALINDLPDEYIIYKEKEFTFNNIRQMNRNRLLWDKHLNIDGIKTGHTKSAGYNLVASVTKGDMRLISAVLGSYNETERDIETKNLLKWGLNFFETMHLFKAWQKITSYPILFGNKNCINLGVSENIYLTLPKSSIKNLKINFLINKKLMHAPINKGKIVGEIIFQIKGKQILKKQLIVLESIKNGNLFDYILDHIKIFLNHLFN